MQSKIQNIENHGQFIKTPSSPQAEQTRQFPTRETENYVNTENEIKSTVTSRRVMARLDRSPAIPANENIHTKTGKKQLERLPNIKSDQIFGFDILEVFLLNNKCNSMPVI
ncbi:hypothetical protein JXI42_03280 [bacterium]|nr:hypothetical protein [bacterium]